MANEREQLKQAMAALEAQRSTLGDAVVDAALGPLREKLAQLSQPEPTGLSAPRSGALQGERKPVTAVLADVKGSTDLAECLSMEDWVEMMNRLFQILEAEIYRFGGEVNQFRGDGLLAFFGAPTVHEDDPERAVLAAMAMQDVVGPYASEWAERVGVELQLRVGVNTGEVIVTNVGDRRQHSEDTAMGKAVALAARMESAAEPGTVLVSDNTYQLVAARFEWQALGEIRVKGIAHPVTVYRPLAHRPGGNARGIAGLASPLVGRNQEFQALRQSLERLEAGVGGVVTLVGEAGLGKSRLVTEMKQIINRKVDPDTQTQFYTLRWFEGRCVSYAMSNAYWLWLDILRGLVGVNREDAPQHMRDVFQDYVQAVCGDCFEAVFLPIARLMSLPLTDEEKALFRDLEGESVRQRIFRAIRTLFERVAQQRPLALVCEDLHWADPTSIELLAHLIPLTDQVPLLFMCVFRPEKAHGSWQILQHAAEYNHTGLMLEPLSATDSAVLVRNLLHVEALPPDLKSRILKYAEGNPFYVEELIRSLMDDGVIVYDEQAGCWSALQDISEIAVPETLRAVLMARIDKLSSETKRVLQLASVIGRIFSYKLLAAVAASVTNAEDEVPGESHDQVLRPHLDILCQMELIRERGTVKAKVAYIFKHHLTQEAAYDSLLHKERRVFHHYVAEALKHLFRDRLWDYDAMLAHHWERAGEPRRAVPHLMRVAQIAIWQYANAEAATYFQRALTLSRESNIKLAEAETLEQLAYVHRRQGNYAEARAYLEEALPIYKIFSNRRQESAIFSSLGVIARRLGHYAEARAHFEKSLRLSRLTRDWRGEAMVLGNLGVTCRDEGHYSDANTYFEQSLRIERAMNNRWGEAVVLSNLGGVCRYLGAYDEARDYLDAALRLNRELHNRRGRAITLANLSLLLHNQGDDQMAYDCARQALQISDAVGDRSGQAYAWMCMGHAQVGLGQLEEAESSYQQAARLRRDLNEVHLEVEALAGLVRVFLAHSADSEYVSIQPYVEQIWEYMQEHPDLEGLEEPVRVYLTCYRALQSVDDDRADDVLQAAYHLLQTRAAAIEDETHRRTFLENVAVHRKIVERMENGEERIERRE